MVLGIDQYYFGTAGYQTMEGREILEEDSQKKRQVAVIDESVQRSLFPDEDPIGKTIEIYGEPFTVIGVCTQVGQSELVVGSALTISAFETILGEPGGWLVCIAIALFAFSTILGWEYHGEKAFEYLFGTHRFNLIYRIVFSLIVFVGATTTLKIAWNFSDIANALMAIPNLICMLAMSGVIVEEVNRYQKVIQKEERK